MNVRDIVYLDYAATTPLDARVAGRLAELSASADAIANPSAIHVAGRRAAAIVDEAKSALGGLLGCRPRDLVLTSGATESDNLAILGGAAFRADRGRHHPRRDRHRHDPLPHPGASVLLGQVRSRDQVQRR